MYILLISLIRTIIFGMIDAGFFFVGSETVQNQLIKIPILNYNMAEVLTGGISASFAIFVSSYVALLIKRKHKIIDNPIIDSIGILVGTIIIVTIYYFISKLRKRDNLN